MLRDFRSLRQTTPGARSTNLSLEKARALLTAQNPQQRFRRTLMRIAVTGIAALVVLALVVVFLPNRRLSAAAELAQAAEASQNFKGWVHAKVRIDITDAEGLRHLMPEGVHQEEVPAATESHLNRADGSTANISQYADGRRTVSLMSVADG